MFPRKKEIPIDIRKGECVHHPQYGIGKVQSIRKLSFSGHEKATYAQIYFSRNDLTFTLLKDELPNMVRSLISATEARELLQQIGIHARVQAVDIEPLQVMIESQVLDVELNEELQFGVNWFMTNNPDLIPEGSGKIVAAGNLPYHISSQIIVALIDNRHIIRAHGEVIADGYQHVIERRHFPDQPHIIEEPRVAGMIECFAIDTE